MSLSWIDIDDELLTAAMRELGTSTAQETVNAALREVAFRARRRAAFDSLAAQPTNQQDAAEFFARQGTPPTP